jgi:phage I-like protein
MGLRTFLSSIGLFASRNPSPDVDGLYAGAIEVPTGEDAPDWVRLLQAGEYINHPDGPHEVTRQHLQEMVDNHQRREVDLLVDKDHDSLFRGETRAAGWIMELELREDGLYGTWPEWTNWGEGLVGSREYRYLSPVYVLNSEAKDGTPQGAMMDSVALTNKPYLDEGEADAISSRTPDPTDQTDSTVMDREDIIDALGLDDDATDEEINQALEAAGDALSEVDSLDDLTGDSPSDEPEGDGNEEEPSSEEPSGEEPTGEEVEDMSEEKINSLIDRRLEEREEDQQAEQLVDQAIANGTIEPSEREIWLNSARADYEGTKDKLENKKAGSSLPQRLRVPDDEEGEKKASSHARAVDHLKKMRGA